METAEIVLRFEGELDMDTEDRFQTALDRCLERRPHELIVDMSDLAFMGAEGIHLLLKLAIGCESIGTELHVFLNRFERRLLDLAGVDNRFRWQLA